MISSNIENKFFSKNKSSEFFIQFYYKYVCIFEFEIKFLFAI
jgi:hypothetical protein